VANWERAGFHYWIMSPNDRRKGWLARGEERLFFFFTLLCQARAKEITESQLVGSSREVHLAGRR
jgi:hypothetical protein